MRKERIRFLLCAYALILLFPANTYAQETQVLPKDSIKEKTNPKKYFELSLGQSILFISNSQLETIKKEESIVVPTSAALFFAELRPAKKIKFPVFLNLPTESKQFIVEGQLVNEKASPTFGTGATFRIFKFKIGERSAIEMEMGPLASFLLNKSSVIRFAPIAAGRIRFIKREDFIIYIGSSYSLGVNAFGILFGTGYVF